MFPPESDSTEAGCAAASPSTVAAHTTAITVPLRDKLVSLTQRPQNAAAIKAQAYCERIESVGKINHFSFGGSR
eukprot:m.177836 g.177836  ORF g.177836 m.177836 type:complete len:74 (+) comp14916_c2_seq1:4244-4465(+)